MTYSDVFGKKALRSLELLPLRSCYQQELQGYLQCIDTLKRLIAEVSETIKLLAEESLQAKLLITIPGISFYSSVLILSEIGDIGRFPSAKKLCSSAGLVPRVHTSGGKTR
jgi:transposase